MATISNLFIDQGTTFTTTISIADSNGAALDGDTLERYAIMLENITSGNVYDTLADARTAVVSWFLDERTPKSPANISKLNKLMTLTGSVDKGLLEPLNSYFTIYNDHSKSILQTDEKFQIYAKININTSPLSAETIKSFDVPLCASAVVPVLFPKTVLINSSLPNDTAANSHLTEPVFVPVTVQ